MSRQRYVYFIAPVGGGPIKIGASFRPMHRLMDINQWVPYPLELLATAQGGMALEVQLHDRFAADWIHGEWFQPSPELLAIVEDAKAGRAIPFEPLRRPLGDGKRLCVSLKKACSRRVTVALEHARKITGESVREPDHIRALMTAYQGPRNPAPTPEQRQIIDDWCSGVLAMEAA